MTTSTAASTTRPMGVGSGMLRPMVAYAALVFADAWLVFAQEAVTRGADPVRAAITGVADLIRFAVPFLVIIAVMLLPAVVGSLELARRYGRSRISWIGLGAIGWLAWGLIVTASLLLGQTISLNPDAVRGVLLAVAGSGAVFGLLAYSPVAARPGRILVGLALFIVAVVVVGSFVTSGMWGRPV